MIDHTTITSVSQLIQLSVAPVFLLTGVAGILSVLSTRLGRVIDRARLVDRRIPTTTDDADQKVLHAEADLLWRRISMINWSIRLSVGSALVICLVVMCLFIGDIAGVNLDKLIAYLFVAAMMLVIAGLLTLLFEVSVSTRKMRQRLEYLLSQSD